MSTPPLLQLTVVNFILVLLFYGSFAAVCTDKSRLPTFPIFTLTVPSTLTSVLNTLFPESKNPVTGFTQTNVVIPCLVGPCYVNITFLLEGAGYRNTLGYAMYDPITFENYSSVVTLWPDVTAGDGSACALVQGQTQTIGPFQSNTTVMFWLYPNGYSSKSKTPQWVSIISPPSFVNADGKDPTTNDWIKHFGWLYIKEFSLIVFGVEDLSGLGDRDFNDVMFTFTVNGTWNSSNIPQYSLNTGIVDICKFWDPNSYPTKITLTQCVIQTIMDDYTNSRECSAYLRLPDGWTVAPNDTYFQQALSASQTNIWSSPYSTNCGVAVAPDNSYVGWSSSTSASCPVAVTTTTFTDGKICYFAKCNSRMILRKGLDYTCNTAVTNKYCTTTPSAATHTLADPPNTLFMFLVPGKALSQKLSFVVQNSLQIFVLMDTFNVALSDLVNLWATLPNFIPQSGMFSTGVSYGYASDGTSSSTLLVPLPFVYSSSDIKTSPSPTYAVTGQPSNILRTLAQVINSTTLGWATDSATTGIKRRIILVVTQASYSSSDVPLLMSSLPNSVAPILFLTPNNLQAYTSLISDNSIPRASAASITWPSSTTDTLWQSVAVERFNRLLNTFEVTVESTAFGNITAGSSVTILTSLNASIPNPTYLTNAIYFNLPAALPVAGTPLSWMAYNPVTVYARFKGTAFTIPLIISWNEPPKVDSAVMTTSCSEDVTCNINFGGSDVNKNKLFVLIYNISNSPMVSFINYGSTPVNWTLASPTKYGGNSFNFRAKQDYYGSFVIIYALNDGCLSTFGQMNVNVAAVNDPPYCYSPEITLEATKYLYLNLSQILGDVDNDFANLTITFLNVSSSIYTDIQFATTSNGAYSIPSLNYAYSVTNLFRLFGKSNGTLVVPYQVMDPSLSTSQTCNITINVFPHIGPPTISVSPYTTLTTVPTMTNSTTITITEPYGTTASLMISIASADFSVIDFFRPSLAVDARPYSLITDVISNQGLFNLTLQMPSGVTSFTFSWTPNTKHLSSTIHRINVWAADDYNQTSSPITLTFNVPPNVPPVWLGTNVSTTFNENNISSMQSYFIPVNGTDSFYQKSFLKLQIISLPSLGVLTDIFGNAISARQVLSLSQSSTVPGQDSVYLLNYQPRVYLNGNDSFTGQFIDIEGAISTVGTISIRILPINNQPQSTNVTANFVSLSSSLVTLVGTDVDMIYDIPPQTLTLVITSVTGLRGSLRTTNGTVVTNGFTVTNGDWTFNYSSIDAGYKESWQFVFIDNFGLSSPVYYAFMNVEYINKPPVCYMGNATGMEDSPLTINMESLYSDPDGPNSQVTLYLRSTPSYGQLVAGNPPSPLIAGSVIPKTNDIALLTFNGPTHWFGTTSFSFYSKDSAGGQSSVDGVFTITLTFVNYPPTISISPANLVVPRTQNGTFTLTISDFDSANLSLVIAANNFPLSFSKVFVGSSEVNVNGTNLTVANYATGKTSFSTPILFSWNPSWTIPEGTTATFSAYAKDSDGGVSPVVQGSVSVVQNNPPFIVSGNYSVTTLEDSFETITFSLIGSDLDIYHRNSLSVFISSVTPGLTLSSGSTIINSFPFQVSNSIGNGNNTVGTVTVTNTKYWNGIFSFTFYVQDLNSPTPAVSSSKTVSLTVIAVNNPPVSQNVTLTISEQYCQLLCPSSYTGTIQNDPFATISATDVDSLILTLYFLSLPSPCSHGAIGFNGPTFSLTGSLDKLTLSNTFLNTAPWNFWFQPQFNKRSNCVSNNCDIFVSVPFVVSDGQANSSVSYLNIVVSPLSGDLYSSSSTCLENGDCPVQLIPSQPSSTSLLQFVNISSLSRLQLTNTFGTPQNNLPITFPATFNTTGITIHGNANVYGDFVLYYQRVDGCFSSPLAKHTISILFVNQPPTCSNISLTVEETYFQSFTFSNSIIQDVDNNFTSLSIVWKSATTSTAGTLQYNSSSTFSTAPSNTPISTSFPYQFYAISKGSYSLQFSAFDGNLLSDSCYLNVNILPKDNPPVVSVSSTSLVTPPDNFGTTNVTISDPVLGDITNFFLRVVTIDWSMIDILRVESTVDPRSYNQTSTISPSDPTTTPFLSNIPLQSGGTISFNLIWKPNKYHTSSTPTHTIEIWAVDTRSQKSNTIQISFTTPPNTPPTFIGTTDNTTYLETTDSSTRHNIVVSGTDTIFQRDRLLLKIVTLPTLGNLFDIQGNIISSGKVLSLALSSTVPTQNSTYTISYQPFPFYSGKDSFTASFIDPEGAESNIGQVSISLVFVNQNPSSQDYSGSLLSYSTISFALEGTDIDLLYNFTSQYLSLELLNVGSLQGKLRRTGNNNSITNNTILADGDWSFTYTSPFGALVDAFNFRFFDNYGGYSPTYTATITVIYRPPPNVPPSVVNVTYYGLEDIPLSFNLSDAFNDTDGNNLNVQIYVTTLPAVGKLSSGTPPLPVVSQLPVNRDSNNMVTVSFIGPPDWFGNVTFVIVAVDDLGAYSVPAIVTLVIGPVNDPPLISLYPSVLPSVARTTTGSFVVSVSDIDSQTISVVLQKTTIQLSTSTLSFNGTLATSTPNSTLLLFFAAGSTYQGSSSIDWTPGYLYPEGQVAEMVLFALDSDGGSSSTVSGSVSILPNNLPTVVDDGSYSKQVYEDQYTSVDFTLVGTDIDIYHRTVLDIIIPTMGFEIPTQLPDGQILSPQNFPLQLNATGTTNTTEATISVLSKKDWNGLFSFSFYVRDINTPIPAASVLKTVTLTVIPVNDPPTSQNVSVTIEQNVCFLSCAWADVQSAATIPSALIPVFDIDSTFLYIDILSLPKKGLLGYRLNPNDETLTTISRVPFTLTNQHKWQFWLQPLIDDHSPGCNITHPDNCDPYATISFQVRDGQDSSGVYDIDFFVTPKNIPPGSISTTAFMDEDSSLSFDLNPYIWDRDSDNSQLKLHVLGFSVSTVGTVTDYYNTSITATGDFEIRDKILIYTPPKYVYSAPDALAEIYFYAEDIFNTTSKVSTLAIYVRPVPHPVVYYGSTEITILEDSFALILIGRRGLDWSCVDLGQSRTTITSLTSKGTWQICSLSECNNVTSIPVVLGDSQNFRFYPLPNDNGVKYANFTFTIELLDSYNTQTYTFQYTINVTPVNDPPVIVPLWDEDGITLDEDTYTHFSFRITDIDSPLSSLTPKLISGSSNANIHQCFNSSNDCSDSPSLTVGTNVPANVNATFLFSYVPLPNVNGKSSYGFVAYDDYNAPSIAKVVKFLVRPINDPPSFTVSVIPSPTYQSLPATRQPYQFVFSELIDIDFYNLQMSLTVTSSFGDFGIVGNTSISECTFFPQKAVCTAKKLKLEKRLSSIVFYPAWGAAPGDVLPTTTNVTNSRMLTFFLTDLGNTDYRPNMWLNQTIQKNVSRVLTPQDSAAITESGNSAGSSVVSVSVGIGLGISLLIVALAFLYFRKSNSEADLYLAEFLDASSLSGAATSPFYQPATTVVHSKLYDNRKE